MDTRISTKRLEVTPRLDDYAVDRIERLDRFVQGLETAEILFDEEANPRITEPVLCEVTLRGHGHSIRAKHRAPDGFAAIDGVVDKLERQLRKLKTRLIRRWQAAGDTALLESAGIDDAEVDVAPPAPKIVKSKKFHIAAMTADEAVLELELVDHDFYFFHNTETARAAIVYRRNDGNYGLIDEAG